MMTRSRGLLTGQQVVDAAEAFFMNVLLPDTDFLQHVMARPANVRALIVAEEIVPTFCAWLQHYVEEVFEKGEGGVGGGDGEAVTDHTWRPLCL